MGSSPHRLVFNSSKVLFSGFFCCLFWGFFSISVSVAGIIFHVYFMLFNIGGTFKKANKQTFFQREVSSCYTDPRPGGGCFCLLGSASPSVCAPSPPLTGPFGYVCLAPTPWLSLTDGLSFRFFPSTHLLLQY